MKMIVALLRSEQLPFVKQSLYDMHIRQFTVTTTLGTATKSEQQSYRGVKREVSLTQRIRLELVLNDAQVDTAVRGIRAGAKESGGWGRIFVLPVEDSITIWTGERGPNTL
ncbi:MAG: nitrogen regulatory protein PII [Planctomycetota bacterium]|jgi:nitrogen regulatory protein PII